MMHDTYRLIQQILGLLARLVLLPARGLWLVWAALQLDPFDWLLITCAIVTRRWEAAAIVAIEFVARRVPFLAYGIADLAGLPIDGEWTARLLPGVGWSDIMSISVDDDTPENGPDRSGVATSPNADNRVATPNNGDNGRLPVNGPAVLLDTVSPDITAAREVIRFQAKVEALADLVRAEKVPQAKGIEIVFHCSRSSRPESTYERARAALKPLLDQPTYRALDEQHRPAGVMPNP